MKTFFIISVISILFLLWYSYHRIQLMYNSSQLSFYTPNDKFPISDEIEYNRMVAHGMVIAKHKKVIIAGLLRDVESKIPEIRRKVERVGEMFRDYQVLLVENDSKDRTRTLLNQWSRENPKVIILGCGYNVSECSITSAHEKTIPRDVSQRRIEKMVRLRNIYLDEIKRSDADYVIVWDLDIIGNIYLDGIAYSLAYMKLQKDVSVMCAYGIYSIGSFSLYYDTYAYLKKGDQFHVDMKSIHDIRSVIEVSGLTRDRDPFEVDSCFSGFSIYRGDAIASPRVWYDMSTGDNVECEHTRLHRKIRGKKMINPKMIYLVVEN